MMLGIPEKHQTRINEFELYSYLKNKTEYEISFTGDTRGYCVGMVDIVNSTTITAKLTNGKMCEYYSVFLNAMSEIIKAYEAKIVKNIGDSLLYYFPKTVDGIQSQSLVDAVDCSLYMIESRRTINKIMEERHLPHFDFRASVDYGPVSIAVCPRTGMEDVFGPTVNLCAKINGATKENSVIIGGDLHQIIRSSKKHEFHSIGQCMLGLKYNYPAYIVEQRDKQELQ